MYKTATQMAKELNIPYNRLVNILYCTGVYHNGYYGYWDTTDIFYRKREKLKNKTVDCFMYDLNQVKQKISLALIACGQAVGRSKKTKRFLIRNYGV
jgi:hypothetical protein